MSTQLELKYIPLSQAATWDRNPKKHDLGAIAQSIAVYGFKDPPKIEPALNAGAGGIVEGNGRVQALTWMKDQGQEPPLGIALDPKTGEWLIPVLFGVDAESQAIAEQYALDHNNLVLAGGDYTAVDISRLWDTTEYLAVLTELANQGAMPVSIDGDDLDLLLRLEAEGANGFAGAEEGEEDQEADGERSDGSLLALAEVVIGEPRAAVEPGDTWLMGNHVLCCADVFSGWEAYTPHLEPGSLLVPHPGPLVALTKKANKHRMVLVQPDPYIAGHIIDRYRNIHGEDSCEKTA